MSEKLPVEADPDTNLRDASNSVLSLSEISLSLIQQYISAIFSTPGTLSINVLDHGSSISMKSGQSGVDQNISLSQSSIPPLMLMTSTTTPDPSSTMILSSPQDYDAIRGESSSTPRMRPSTTARSGWRYKAKLANTNSPAHQVARQEQAPTNTQAVTTTVMAVLQTPGVPLPSMTSRTSEISSSSSQSSSELRTSVSSSLISTPPSVSTTPSTSVSIATQYTIISGNLVTVASTASFTSSPTATVAPTQAPDSSSQGLSVGAKVGITVGVVITVIIVGCLLAYLHIRRRRNAHKQQSGPLGGDREKGAVIRERGDSTFQRGKYTPSPLSDDEPSSPQNRATEHPMAKYQVVYPPSHHPAYRTSYHPGTKIDVDSISKPQELPTGPYGVDTGEKYELDAGYTGEVESCIGDGYSRDGTPEVRDARTITIGGHVSPLSDGGTNATGRSFLDLDFTD